MFVRAIEMLTAGIESSAAVDGGGFSLDSSLRNSRSNESFRAVSSTRFSARTYGRLRACTQTDRYTETDRHRETDKQSDSKTIRQRERQTDTERQTESKTDRYRHRESDRQSDRQIQRDMHIDTWTD